MVVDATPLTIDDASVSQSFATPVKIARTIAIILFGLVFPLIIAIGVSGRIDRAEGFVERASSGSYVMEQFAKQPNPFKSANDYALIALADSERANLAVMINKQVMKLVIVYMGFAVMSFAMMFIVLGITDGPVLASGAASGFKFSLQFGSIGAAVFVLGAAMSAGGGLLRNDYHTVGLPGFLGSESGPALKGHLGEAVAICAEIESEDRQAACVRATVSPAEH